jgi:CheY-like chemotaxis protein
VYMYVYMCVYMYMCVGGYSTLTNTHYTTLPQVLDICKEGVQFNANALQAGGGSGLGLFIGKGLVEQQGGKMTVSSEGLGMGVTVVFELPLFLMERMDLLSPNISDKRDIINDADELEAGVPLSPLPPVFKHLLVVDDAMSNRKLLLRILRAKGYVCSEAADGQLALKVYQSMCDQGTPPCCVLMDFEMPNMNGPTATKHLREMGCDCYIMGVTGNVMQSDVDVFIQHGANVVLSKPLRIEIFESMVREQYVQ